MAPVDPRACDDAPRLARVELIHRRGRKLDADLDHAKEARQWSDRLGLNPSAMLRNRWRIAPDQVTEARTAKVAPAVSRTSARDRLKAVNDV